MAQKKRTTLSDLQEKVAEHAKKTKELQARIREIEDEHCLKIGKLVVDFQKKNWEGFDAAAFKKTVTDILES